MLNRYAVGLSLHRRAEVAALYRRVFPPSERIALPLLSLGTLRHGVGLEVYEENGAPTGVAPPSGGSLPGEPAGGGAGDSFVGFTYTVQTPEVFFLLFLAVDEARQGRGYGSQILGDVLERAGTRPVVLEIEPLDPEAGNIGQRYRRLAFYRRHGLELTGFDVIEGGERYTVLSSDPPLDVPALGRALRRLVPRPLRLPGLETTRFWPEQKVRAQACRSASGRSAGEGGAGGASGGTATPAVAAEGVSR